MAGYIGATPVPQGTQSRTRFLAANGQDTFYVPTFTIGYVDVYLNGIKLDYTDFATPDSNTIVLQTPATADDIVEIVSLGEVTLSATSAAAIQDVFWENNSTINASYTITGGKNAGSFGPVTIANGVTVTVPNGSTWTIV